MSQIVSSQQRADQDGTLVAHQRGVELAIACMRESFGEPLALDDLADVAFMSRYHFNRVFTKIAGVSPCRFLAAIRMQEAKRLLLKTHRSVTDISLDVGYNSLGTFTRIFADFVGFAPVRFRQLAVPLRSMEVSTAITFLHKQQEISPSAPVVGEVRCSNPLSLIIVGMFQVAIPRSDPTECTVLQGTTRFAFDSRPRRGWRIYAAGLLPGASLEDAMLATRGSVLVGSTILDSIDGQHGDISVELREGRTIDPPVVVAFPLILLESVLGRRLGYLEEAAKTADPRLYGRPTSID